MSDQRLEGLLAYLRRAQPHRMLELDHGDGELLVAEIDRLRRLTRAIGLHEIAPLVPPFATPSVELELAGTAEAGGTRVAVSYRMRDGERVCMGELYASSAGHVALQLLCVALDLGAGRMRNCLRVHVAGID